MILLKEGAGEKVLNSGFRMVHFVRSTERENHPPVVLFIGANTDAKRAKHRIPPQTRLLAKMAKNGVFGLKTAFIFPRCGAIGGPGRGRVVGKKRVRVFILSQRK